MDYMLAKNVDKLLTFNHDKIGLEEGTKLGFLKGRR